MMAKKSILRVLESDLYKPNHLTILLDRVGMSTDHLLYVPEERTSEYEVSKF